MSATLAATDGLATSLLLTDYASTRPDIVALYERSKGRQWNATTDLPWETLVALDAPIIVEERLALYGTPQFEAMSPAARKRYNVLETAWIVSQFLHAEQTSMIACGQLMVMLPDIDAKLYAASQGYDEARHAECYRRYLDEKLGIIYPIDDDLKFLCDAALNGTEWASKLVASQLIVESFTLGSFKTILTSAVEPLLIAMLAHIVQDEARHVAFGRLALERSIRESSESDRACHEDFVAACARVLYDGFFPRAVFEELGLPDIDRLRTSVFASNQQRCFRENIFAVLIPGVRDIGLLTKRTKQKYVTLGIDVDAI